MVRNKEEKMSEYVLHDEQTQAKANGEERKKKRKGTEKRSKPEEPKRRQ
jgi:hypothetical protein